MRTVFAFVLLWASLLIEFLTGQIGLPLLLAALVVYYISLADSLEMGFTVAIGFGILTDLVYCRSLPVTAAILCAALLAGRLIRIKPPNHPLETAMPGMGVALVALLGGGLARIALSRQPENFADLGWQLIFFGVIGLCLMPLLTAGLDAAGGKLGLAPAVQDAKSNFERLRPRRVSEPRKERKP